MSPLADHLLSTLLLVPVLAAAMVAVVSKAGARRAAAASAIATGAAIAVVSLASTLWVRYDPQGKTWQFAERGPGISVIGASYYVGADGVSIALVLAIAIGGLAAMLAARGESRGRPGFCAPILVMQAGLLGVLVALDFLLFCVSWAIALGAAHSLIRSVGGGAVRTAGRAFLAVNASAVALVFAGILFIYFDQASGMGLRSFDVALFQTLNLAPAVQGRAFVPMALGFAFLVPVFPFNRWVHIAHGVLPAAVSTAIAVALATIGVSGVFRLVLPVLPDASRSLAPGAAAIALLAAAVCTALALIPRGRARRASWSSAAFACLAFSAVYGLADHRVWTRVAALFPAPSYRLVETSVGRVVGRVHPELAPSLPRGSDCATPAPPEPAGPPPGFVLTAPCADGSDAAPKPPPPGPGPH